MRFFIVRHAETDWSKEQRLQGQTDIPLNQNGLAQAAELAERLSGTDITHILTSDLSRARETGRVVAERLSLPFLVDSRLAECRFGSIEGLARKEIVTRHGETFIASVNRLYDFHSVGGERYDEVLQR
ncbi:MAG: histidine phosphatase family protein, partial [Candidatus Uhrbacteria bacterium]|nr:histidine phosphatase family protein [Candidatus Uhrbacteria bacterium]